VIDISDPEDPQGVGYHRAKGQAWRVAVSGNRACLVSMSGNDSGNGLYLIDVSNPNLPREEAYLDLGDAGGAGAVAISGS